MTLILKRNLIYLNKKQILGKLDNSKQKEIETINTFIPFSVFCLKQEKVIYYSYWGDQYSCSPKAVYETLEKQNPEYKIYG